MDLDCVLVYKHARKELGQYLAILTSHLVNNVYLEDTYMQQSFVSTSIHSSEIFLCIQQTCNRRK